MESDDGGHLSCNNTNCHHYFFINRRVATDKILQMYLYLQKVLR